MRVGGVHARVYAWEKRPRNTSDFRGQRAEPKQRGPEMNRAELRHSRARALLGTFQFEFGRRYIYGDAADRTSAANSLSCFPRRFFVLVPSCANVKPGGSQFLSR